MLVLLGLALSASGAGAFVVQVASSCPLNANGSVLAFNLTVLFNKMPLVCYAPDAQRFVPCAGGGLLEPVAVRLADLFNQDAALARRAEERQRACHQLVPDVWTPAAGRRVPPKIRIVPSKVTATTVLLTCHVWGFYPPEVTVLWLRNGVLAGPGDLPGDGAVPNGDWTYQTRVTLLVAPAPGDTFTCSVQHVALPEPLTEDWAPSLSRRLVTMVAAATVMMVLGLGVFVAGVCRYRVKPPAPGYTPLPGDNYPAGGI